MPTAQPIAIHGEADASGIPDEIIARQSQQRQQEDLTFEVDLIDEIYNLIKKIKLRHRTELLRRIRKWAQIIDFYHNRQWGEVRGGVEEGRWMPADTTAMPIEDRVFFLSNNQVRTNVGTLLGVWSRSDPRILSEPAKETDQAQMMSRFSNGVIDLFLGAQIDEDYRQREAKLALLPGNWLCYQYFDPSGKGESIQFVPRVPVSVKLTPDLLTCAACNKTIPAPDPSQMAQPQMPNQPPQPDMSRLPDQIGNTSVTNPAQPPPQPDLNLGQQGIPQLSDQRCPDCAGPMMVKPGATLNGDQDGEPVNVPVGEVFSELVNPAEICLELRARRLQDSMYLLRTRVLPIELLEYVFSWAKVPQTALSVVSWELKRLEVALGTANEDRSGYGPTIQDGFANDTELDEAWFEPALYARWKTRDDVQVGNMTIPRGTKVIDAFKYGMHVKYVDREPLHLRPESKNDFWVMGKYDPPAEAIWADGAADDLIDPQIATNEAESLRMENLKENAVTHTLVNAIHVDPNALDGFPDSVTAMNNTGAEVNPNSTWSQIPGSELRGVEEFIAEKKADMRESAKAGAELAGNIQNNNRTATGISVARGQQVEQLGPSLSYRAFVVCQIVKQMLKIKQANYIPGQYKDVLGDYSDLEEQAFINGSVDRDIRIAKQEGSWLPRSVDQERADMVAYTQMRLGLLQQYPNGIPPAIEDWMQRAFNVPFSMEEYNPDNRIAVVRIDLAWSLIKNPQSLTQVGLAGINPMAPPPDPGMKPVGPPGPDGQPTPAPTNPAYIQYAMALKALAAQIPVEVLVDDHQVFIYKYRAYLKTDRGRKAPPLFRQLLIQKIEEHMNAQAVEQQQQAARQAPQQIATAKIQADLNAENTAKQVAAEPEDDGKPGQ